MKDQQARETLWTALVGVDRYVAHELVNQIGSSASFGGEDMRPVLEAYWTANAVRPFMPNLIMEAVDSAFELLQRDLNACLEVLRKATSSNPPPYEHSIAILNATLRECSATYRRNLQCIESKLREYAEEKMTEKGVQANFYGPVSGTVNLGTLLGNISSNMTTLKGDTHTRDFAETIEKLIGAIEDGGDLAEGTREEVLENVKTLSKQATLPQSEREIGVVRASLKYLPTLFSSTASGIKIWETFGPSIEHFFRTL